MPTGANQGCARLRLFWRRLVGAAAIYALVMQPLLLAAGAQFAEASVLDNVAFSQLCQHNADGSPVSPANQEHHPAHQHCLQCFSGAFALLGAPQSFVVASIDRQFRKLRESGRSLRLPSLSQYSVARPRGPPLSV